MGYEGAGDGVAHILIDIVLIGFVAYAATRRKGRPRASTPTARAASRPEPGPHEAVRRAVPETTLTKPTVGKKTEAQAAIQAPTFRVPTSRAATPTASSHYLLGAQRTDGRRDRMAETLEMMAGPGICTPIDR
jgi:hypothetical protein